MKRSVVNGISLVAAAVAMCSLGIIISAASQPQAMNSNQGGKMMMSSMDNKFMMMAAQGGMAEVAMARLAVDHASSDDVKRYAERMIEDHTKAGEELMQLASTKGVALPTAPDAKHQAMLTKMGTLSGAAFDREYVKNAGVKDHEKMEKLFMDESGKGKDADAKAFAAKTLPTVQMHLSMARDMMNSMMGGSKMKM
jgi:putative membrane protein